MPLEAKSFGVLFPHAGPEVLTQSKHLKIERLPGRRERRAAWNEMGWGMATGRAQKILKLGDYQRLPCPRGQLAIPIPHPHWRKTLRGAGAPRVAASGGSIFSTFSTNCLACSGSGFGIHGTSVKLLSQPQDLYKKLGTNFAFCVWGSAQVGKPTGRSLTCVEEGFTVVFPKLSFCIVALY